LELNPTIVIQLDHLEAGPILLGLALPLADLRVAIQALLLTIAIAQLLQGPTLLEAEPTLASLQIVEVVATLCVSLVP